MIVAPLRGYCDRYAASLTNWHVTRRNWCPVDRGKRAKRRAQGARRKANDVFYAMRYAIMARREGIETILSLHRNTTYCQNKNPLRGYCGSSGSISSLINAWSESKPVKRGLRPFLARTTHPLFSLVGIKTRWEVKKMNDEILMMSYEWWRRVFKAFFYVLSSFIKNTE